MRPNKERINSIIKNHEKWVLGKDGGEQAVFKGMDLTCVDFQGADLRKAIFRKCIGLNTDFTGCNLFKADFQGANLDYPTFESASLTLANFKNATLLHANFHDSRMYDANFKNANLKYVSWPLYQGILNTQIDDDMVVQLLYYTLLGVQNSEHVSQELKKKLLTKEYVEIANRFHCIGECPTLEEVE